MPIEPIKYTVRTLNELATAQLVINALPNSLEKRAQQAALNLELYCLSQLSPNAKSRLICLSTWEILDDAKAIIEKTELTGSPDTDTVNNFAEKKKQILSFLQQFETKMTRINKDDAYDIAVTLRAFMISGDSAAFLKDINNMCHYFGAVARSLAVNDKQDFTLIFVGAVVGFFAASSVGASLAPVLLSAVLGALVGYGVERFFRKEPVQVKPSVDANTNVIDGISAAVDEMPKGNALVLSAG